MISTVVDRGFGRVCESSEPASGRDGWRGLLFWGREGTSVPLTYPVLAESGERTHVDSKGKLDVRLREELIVLSLS